MTTGDFGGPRRSNKPQKRQPKYAQIADEVRRQIQDLPPGTRCPGITQISRQFKIGHATAERVLEHLKDQGIVRIVPGSGTYVAERNTKKLAILSYHTESSQASFGDGPANQQCRGLSEVLARHLQHAGHQVQVFPRTGSHGPDVNHVTKFKPDLLIAACIANNDYLEQLSEWGRPVVSVMHAPLSLPMDFVFPSTLRSGYVAARSLFRAGLADAWYVGALYGSTNASINSMTQCVGFLSACLDIGLNEPASRLRMVHTESDLLELIEQFFDHQSRPQAIVTVDNWIGQRFLVAAQRRGLRVPKDLAIFAAGGEEPCSVSCLATDNAEIAALTANLIHTRLQRPDMPAQDLHVVSRFVDAGTIPPAAARHVLRMLPNNAR